MLVTSNRFFYLKRELFTVWRFKEIQLRRPHLGLCKRFSFKAICTVQGKVPSIPWRATHMLSLSSDFVGHKMFLEQGVYFTLGKWDFTHNFIIYTDPSVVGGSKLATMTPTCCGVLHGMRAGHGGLILINRIWQRVLLSRLDCHNKSMTWFLSCVCCCLREEREIESHSILSEGSCHVLSSPWRSPGGKNLMSSANGSWGLKACSQAPEWVWKWLLWTKTWL